MLDRSCGRTLMLSADVQRSDLVVQSKTAPAPSLAAVMVHVDLERDCEPRIELAMGLADRFRATLIGVAGCATWPAFMAGDVGLTKSNQYDFQKIMLRFEQRGRQVSRPRSLAQTGRMAEQVGI